jgi:uroporphyrinogen decarboxylase
MPENAVAEDFFHYEIRCFGADTSLLIPTKLVEETEEYKIEIDANGATRKNWKNATSTPECIDFMIKDKKIWEQYSPNYKKMEGRIDPKQIDIYRRKKEEGYFICHSGALGYDKTQAIVGSERLLMAMALEPDWVKDMFSASAEILIRTAEAMMSQGYQFDGVFLYDDLGYRNASLFSPEMYKKLLLPAHKRACDFFHSKNLKVILHSCGCVKGLIPYLIEAGFNCLQPLEVKAGMDLVELKKKYGKKLSFMGGIDVRKMSNPDPRVIEEEIKAKIGFAKKGGGYIYHSDHSVPDDISLSQYQRVLELVKTYGAYS